MELNTSRPKKFLKYLQYEIRQPFAGALNILAKIVRDATVHLFHGIISCSRVNVREKLIIIHLKTWLPFRIGHVSICCQRPLDWVGLNVFNKFWHGNVGTLTTESCVRGSAHVGFGRRRPWMTTSSLAAKPPTVFYSLPSPKVNKEKLTRFANILVIFWVCSFVVLRLWVNL